MQVLTFFKCSFLKELMVDACSVSIRVFTQILKVIPIEILTLKGLKKFLWSNEALKSDTLKSLTLHTISVTNSSLITNADNLPNLQELHLQRVW